MVKILTLFSQTYIVRAKYTGIMNTQRTLVILAVVMALGLVTVVAVDAILSMQQTEAACEKGPAGSHAFNKSKGRCLDGGTI
jgi:hypothetical protein